MVVQGCCCVCTYGVPIRPRHEGREWFISRGAREICISGDRAAERQCLSNLVRSRSSVSNEREKGDREERKRERELISLMVLGETAAKSDETFFFPHAHLSLSLYHPAGQAVRVIVQRWKKARHREIWGTGNFRAANATRNTSNSTFPADIALR